jgi:hypothetical protein
MDDEYPSEETLKKIEEWPLNEREDYAALAEFICSVWHYGEPWCKLTGKRVKTLRLATGGWSGNESILAALDKNVMFGMLCWQMSKRGGLHIYKIPALKN